MITKKFRGRVALWLVLVVVTLDAFYAGEGAVSPEDKIMLKVKGTVNGQVYISRLASARHREMRYV